MNKKEKHEWKSNTFALLMKQPKYALQTFNALNGTDYKDPGIVEILEYETGVVLSVRSDSAYVIEGVITIGEQQATYNPNMPLRLLTYISNAYRILTKNQNIYSSTLVKIPNPRLVVFYNGKQKRPEREVLKLSDAYKLPEKDPWVELKCLVININPSFNDGFKNECEAIYGYSVYTEKVNKYREEKSVRDAIEKAINECIDEGILVDFFRENKTMIMTMEAWDYTVEAREKWAMQEGIEQGRKDMIINALRKGHTPEDVSEFVDIPLEEVLEVQKSMMEEE